MTETTDEAADASEVLQPLPVGLAEVDEELSKLSQKTKSELATQLYLLATELLSRNAPIAAISQLTQAWALDPQLHFLECRILCSIQLERVEWVVQDLKQLIKMRGKQDPYPYLFAAEVFAHLGFKGDAMNAYQKGLANLSPENPWYQELQRRCCVTNTVGCPILKLPTELFLRIMDYLTVEQVMVVQAVCKTWNAIIAQYPSVWAHISRCYIDHTETEARKAGNRLKTLEVDDLMCKSHKIQTLVDARCHENLRSLYLHGALDPIEWNHLSPILSGKRLAIVDLSNSDLRDMSILRILENVPTLRELILRHVRFECSNSIGLNAEWAASFSHNLVKLDMNQSTGHSPEISTLLWQSLPNVTHLDLGNPSLTQNSTTVDVETLASKSNIKHLGLGFLSATDDTVVLDLLHGCPQLEKLYLDSAFGRSTTLSVEQLEELAPASHNLLHLSFEGSKVSDNLLTVLTSRLPKLKHLDLERTPIRASTLRYLGQLSSLESLNLAHIEVIDRQVENVRPPTPWSVFLEAFRQMIESLQNLKSLDISDTPLMNYEILEYIAFNCQHRLQELRISAPIHSDEYFDDHCLSKISRLEELRKLYIQNVQQYTGKTGFEKIFRSCTKLEVVYLRDCESLEDKHLDLMANLHNLVSLHIVSSSLITSSGIREMLFQKKGRKFNELDVLNCKLVDDSLLFYYRCAAQA